MQEQLPLLGMPTSDRAAAAENDADAAAAAAPSPAFQPRLTEAPATAITPAPAPRRRSSTLLTVCPFILGNEFCERLAFYG
jgi:hypothetical protein